MRVWMIHSEKIRYANIFELLGMIRQRDKEKGETKNSFIH